ncbi:MAG: MOSC domain-containing protein [Rhodobacteraceae bacterium]|nr:MOSC domain-containing protein [Paracoccaceae bacterium]
MSVTLFQIWRHPIKGIGVEALDTVGLKVDRPLPLDRAWAVLEEGGEATEGWRPCRNFLRGAKGPALMAVTARVEEEMVHLSHPNRPDLAINPDAAEAALPLFDWLAPIYPKDRRPAAALVKAPGIGLADANFASVSILNCASLCALSRKLGRNLDPRRFRGNLWLEGLAPWEEFDLVGKRLRIGVAELELVEPISRCRATEASPETGCRDTATLQALEDGWGHTRFGAYAMVRRGGKIGVGDRVLIV